MALLKKKQDKKQEIEEIKDTIIQEDSEIEEDKVKENTAEEISFEEENKTIENPKSDENVLDNILTNFERRLFTIESILFRLQNTR